MVSIENGKLVAGRFWWLLFIQIPSMPTVILTAFLGDDLDLMYNFVLANVRAVLETVSPLGAYCDLVFLPAPKRVQWARLFSATPWAKAVKMCIAGTHARAGLAQLTQASLVA